MRGGTRSAPTSPLDHINGLFNSTYHRNIWRPRFYEAAQGSTTIAQWASDFLAGKTTQVGP